MTADTRQRRSGQLTRGALPGELVGCAVLLGLAIFVAEGNLAGPLVATVLSVLIAALTLFVWVFRTGSLEIPVGLSWLLLLMTAGSISAVVALGQGRGGEQVDLVRDVAIILSYAGFLLVGYYYGRERRSVRLLWWILLGLGGLRSANHLWLFAGQVSAGVSDVYVLRLEAGRGEQVQLVALIAAFLLLRGEPKTLARRVVIGVVVLCGVSIVLALSRVLLLQAIIVVMIFLATRVESGRGSLRFLVARAVIVVAAGVTALSLLVFSLRYISEPVYAFVYDGFVEKLLNSWNEIASTSLQTSEDIDANYRAFEAERGMNSVAEAGWFGQWFGQGWGASVPLGLDTASTRSEFVRTEAAFLHNGYINYLVKTGVMGLVAYVGFMIRLVYLSVFQPEPRTLTGVEDGRRQALLAAVLCLAATSLTAGGFGFPSGFLSVALLIGTCLYTPSPRLVS